MKMGLTWKGLPDLETVQSQTPPDKITRRADRPAEQPDLISHIIIHKRKSVNLMGSSAAVVFFTILPAAFSFSHLMLNLWARFSNGWVCYSCMLFPWASVIVTLLGKNRPGRLLSVQKQIPAPGSVARLKISLAYLKVSAWLAEDERCLFEACWKRPAEKQSSLPAISQGLKYSRGRFCSDGMKGLSSHSTLHGHIQPAPPGEGESLYTSLRSQQKHKNEFQS